MHKPRWMICDRNGMPIILRINNLLTGRIEDMQWFASWEAAQQALDMMSEVDKKHHGAQIQKVVLS